MAKSHIYSLLILIVSLFSVQAALGRTVGPTGPDRCGIRSKLPVEVSKVEMFPETITVNVNANLTVTGVASKNIASGNVSVIIGSLTLVRSGLSKLFSVCELTKCPIVPGPVVFNFPNIFTKNQLAATKYRGGISMYQRPKVFPDMCMSFEFEVKK